MSTASNDQAGDKSAAPGANARPVERQVDLAAYDRGENKVRAHLFYRTVGMAEAKIPSHVAGVDTSKPVAAVVINPGVTLKQFRRTDRPLGSYFSPATAEASELGINMANRVEERLQMTRGVTALKSTTADIIDTWSDPRNPKAVKGGGEQYYVPSLRDGENATRV